MEHSLCQLGLVDSSLERLGDVQVQVSYLCLREEEVLRAWLESLTSRFDGYSMWADVGRPKPKKDSRSLLLIALRYYL